MRCGSLAGKDCSDACSTTSFRPVSSNQWSYTSSVFGGHDEVIRMQTAQSTVSLG